MKRLIINVVMVAVGLGVSLAPRTCEAAENDLRESSIFEGNWCGYDAVFKIGKKRGNTWEFDGKILIKATGQSDRIWVEQYEDNHLRIVRYLSGDHTGKTQTVETYPPETLKRNGYSYVNFKVRNAWGVGGKPQGHLHMPKQ